MQIVKLAFSVFCLCLFVSTQAQTLPSKNYNGWHVKDAKSDTLYGISLNKAYDLLKGKKSTPVIVAVIDSGIDTAHEDLRPVLWRNVKEIPGNGIDDDNNGYVDDYYGWNFLGNKNGDNVNKENAESLRVYNKYKLKYEGKNIDESKLTPSEKEEYLEWKRAEAESQPDPKEQIELMYLDVALKSIVKNDSILRADMGKDEYTLDELEAYIPKTEEAKKAKLNLISTKKLLSIEDLDVKGIIKELGGYVSSKKEAMEARNKPMVDYRKIVGDNYSDINDKYYGNPDVMGPDAMHGTHVSGIIGAVRNNKLGMDGVADNVQIMMIRAVPDGDEYDKDIALAIKYAVDNGAKVINMSFGKSFSPEKHWVDDAVRYAAEHDVLIVHAAGNDAKNIDEKPNFPHPAYKNKTLGRAPNYITVGASSDPGFSNKNLIANFSNYGPGTVDIFAPGTKIYSTIPGGNKYAALQGTSMAAPVVAGVAALIRSYFPKLTALQVKNAIEKSAVKIDSSDIVFINPGTLEKVAASELSKTGGFLNAAAAIAYAEKLNALPSATKPTGPKSNIQQNLKLSEQRKIIKKETIEVMQAN